MEGALTNIPGVVGAEVDYSAKSATIAVEDGAEVSDEQLVAALEEAGFGGSVED